MAKVSFIVAMAKNRVIGKDNTLPWHLPADLQHFKQLTLGKPIIMGRKTYESIGRPLPNRTNIIITRDPQFTAEGCKVCHSVAEAFALVADSEELMVIGGAAIFAQCFPMADTMYLTYIDAELTGDTYFPAWNAAEWQEVERQNCQPDEKNAYAYSFVTLKRKL